MTRNAAYVFANSLTTAQRNMLRVLVGTNRAQRQNLKAALGLPCRAAIVHMMPAPEPEADFGPVEVVVGQ